MILVIQVSVMMNGVGNNDDNCAGYADCDHDINEDDNNDVN